MTQDTTFPAVFKSCTVSTTFNTRHPSKHAATAQPNPFAHPPSRPLCTLSTPAWAAVLWVWALAVTQSRGVPAPVLQRCAGLGRTPSGAAAGPALVGMPVVGCWWSWWCSGIFLCGFQRNQVCASKGRGRTGRAPDLCNSRYLHNRHASSQHRYKPAHAHLLEHLLQGLPWCWLEVNPVGQVCVARPRLRSGHTKHLQQ